MMRFALKLESGNESANTEPKAIGEVAQMLRHVADDLREGWKGNALCDLNGNTVGRWTFEFEEEEEG